MAELMIHKKYYNTLYVEGFSRMVKAPSYCYKFYWLEASVWLISENRKEATYNDIIDEMIANAWYSVLEFHVHLSGISMDGQIKDNLEKAVCKLYVLSGLSSDASKTEIKNQIYKFDKSLYKEKMELTKNVIRPINECKKPCAFEKYELFNNGSWVKVTNGIPTNKDRIRFRV